MNPPEVPLWMIVVLACIAAALSGCAPSVTVAQPDVTITPPAALMSVPEPLQPVIWQGKGKLPPTS